MTGKKKFSAVVVKTYKSFPRYFLRLTAIRGRRHRQQNRRLMIHSDRGVQYLAIRYTERLAANGVVNSVGFCGDSYDNAMAESIFGLYKTELIRNKRPWRGLDDVELATLEWVDWFNHRRIFHELGRIPPAAFEDQHYRHNNSDR